ncbi:MAG TPA: hypothetical protein VEU62_01310, partial [Bryobacterales bacterium]|nr:hypothetical protein [Bryobacterales bacterium]
MKMSFFPGKLFLESKPDGVYELRFGDEVQTFKSEKQAVAAFQQIRTRLEKDFPVKEPTLEERRALLQKEIAESAVG